MGTRIIVFAAVVSQEIIFHLKDGEVEREKKSELGIMVQGTGSGKQRTEREQQKREIRKFGK